MGQTTDISSNWWDPPVTPPIIGCFHLNDSSDGFINGAGCLVTREWRLDSYSKMSDKKWVELPADKKTYLLIKDTQLMIISDGVALESSCLLGGGGVIEVVYSNQNMGISSSLRQAVKSKFKIRFAKSYGKTAEDNCIEAVELLEKYVSVTEHPSHKGRKPGEQVTKTMKQVMKEVLDGNPDFLKNSEIVLPEKNIEEIVQQCLLDPGFPALVAKVGELLENRSNDEI